VSYDITEAIAIVFCVTNDTHGTGEVQLTLAPTTAFQCATKFNKFAFYFLFLKQNDQPAGEHLAG